MKKYAYIILIMVLSSCSETIEPISVDNVNEVEKSLDTIDSTGFYEQSDNQAIYELEMKKDLVYDFFYWYIENNETLMRKHNEVIAVVDNFYAIDNTNLSDYLTYLEQTGYFSQEFIEKEIVQWKEICGNEISLLREQNIKAEEMPPCVLEGDPIFFVQDVIEKATVDKMNVTLNYINDSVSNIEYGSGYECTIKFKDNAIQLISWPSM